MPGFSRFIFINHQSLLIKLTKAATMTRENMEIEFYQRGGDLHHDLKHTVFMP